MRAFALAVLLFPFFASSTVFGETIVFSEDFEGVTPPVVPSDWSAQSMQPSVDFSLDTESSVGNPSQALVLDVDASDVASGSSYAVLAEYRWIGSLPTDDLSKLRLTADVAASEAGRTVFVHFFSQSDTSFSSTTGKADWSGTTQTDYVEFGGLLSTFNTDPTPLDTDAPAFMLGFRMQSDFGRDSGNTLRIDNVRLTVVPEPASASLLILSSVVLACRRRR